jgi:hypothetical protein
LIISTGGALVVANNEEEKREQTFRGMMIGGIAVILAAPAGLAPVCRDLTG